jgi:ubiquinone/menaquinone biosynthesis C-methylase UbiE
MNISELKKCYKRGENITALLKENGINAQKGIEISYDLQAGSYSDYALNNRDNVTLVANEMGEILKQYIHELNTILDCGTGEMTTLTEVLQNLPTRIETLAFDISLSRIRAGREYVARTQGSAYNQIRSFVASMDGIPLANDSVDIVITSHALEPNHGREDQLLGELFRVSRGKVILFEPSW